MFRNSYALLKLSVFESQHIVENAIKALIVNIPQECSRRLKQVVVEAEGVKGWGRGLVKEYEKEKLEKAIKKRQDDEEG